MSKSILIIEADEGTILAIRKLINKQDGAYPTKNVVFHEGRPNKHTPSLPDGYPHARKLLDLVFESVRPI